MCDSGAVGHRGLCFPAAGAQPLSLVHACARRSPEGSLLRAFRIFPVTRQCLCTCRCCHAHPSLTLPRLPAAGGILGSELFPVSDSRAAGVLAAFQAGPACPTRAPTCDSQPEMPAPLPRALCGPGFCFQSFTACHSESPGGVIEP